MLLIKSQLFWTLFRETFGKTLSQDTLFGKIKTLFDKNFETIPIDIF